MAGAEQGPSPWRWGSLHSATHLLIYVLCPWCHCPGADLTPGQGPMRSSGGPKAKIKVLAGLSPLQRAENLLRAPLAASDRCLAKWLQPSHRIVQVQVCIHTSPFYKDTGRCGPKARPIPV